jgi:acyl carrier protein
VSEDAIMEALTEIFREVFDDETITLTMDTTADDIERWDSFNHINILVASEGRFSIKFKTAEIEELRNVGEFVYLIAKKLHATPAQ